jgi:hypothetical protein
MTIDKIITLKLASLIIPSVKFFCQKETGYTQYCGGYSLPNNISRNGGGGCEKPTSENIDKKISVQSHIENIYFHLLLKLDKRQKPDMRYV